MMLRVGGGVRPQAETGGVGTHDRNGLFQTYTYFNFISRAASSL